MTVAPRRAVVGLAVALPAVVASACQSTQDTSAMKARDVKRITHAKGLTIGRLNPDAKVVRTFVVHDANGTAAVAEIRNGGPAQASIPVGVALTDQRGRVVYRNDAAGLERSLVELAFVGEGDDTFWVNNQIPTVGGTPKATIELGVAEARPPATVPRMVVSRVRLGSDTSGVFAKGVVTNRSKIEQRSLVISCVARKGGRVVAAGRAIVEKVPPAPTTKPTRFTVFFIGNPKGARLTFSAPPTVLK